MVIGMVVDLPIEQPTKVERVENMKAAKGYRRHYRAGAAAARGPDD